MSLGDRRRSVATALALALATLLAACGSDSSVTGSGPSAAKVGRSPLLPDKTAALPSFDFASYERLLYQLRGTPVVVNLWASWCGPCRSETPTLVAAAKHYGHKVQFLGVDYQDDRGSAAAFIRRAALPYPSIADPSGAIHNNLGFVGLPDTIFYAADGSIAATWSGPLTTSALRANIAQILAQ